MATPLVGVIRPHAASPAARAPSRARAAGLAVVLALLVLATGARPAHAHGASAGIRYELTGVTPEVDGLTVQVVRGLAAQLVVGNATGQPVEVLDDAGRPYLRIGPDEVSGDVASEAWASSDRPFGLAATPDGAAADGPRWQPLAEGASWGWYDHRLHEQQLAVPADADGPVELVTWRVPLRVGDQRVEVTGRTLGGPPRGVVAPRLASRAQLADGVRVTLLPGQATGLLLEVDPGHRALVRGEAGEPFLRFAQGRVDVNAASPTWHRTGGGQASPVAVDADADPAWQTVASTQRYGWIEPRAAAPEVDGNPPTDEVLATWAVPVEVDGTTETVVGELRWVRTALTAAPTGGGRWVDLLLAGAGLATVAALVVVRRRSRARAAA